MNDLITFANDQFGEVRGIEICGQPWLVGKDVAEILGYSNPNEALGDHVDEEDNIVYDEIPIGIIPESCGAKLEYDKEKEKTYCVVNGYVIEEYAPLAVEILEREEECPCSVELSVRELSYDSKEKVLNIDDFFFSGVTILGKTEDGEDV